MDQPLLETIAEAIVDRVVMITPENNYYDFTLTAERLTATHQPKPFNAVVYQDQIRDVDSLNHCEWIVTFAIAVPILPSEGDTTPLDTYQNRVCACLHRAMFTGNDGQFDGQLGGLAVRLDVRAPAMFAVLPSGIRDGITFYIDVQYRHSLTDPTQPA